MPPQGPLETLTKQVTTENVTKGVKTIGIVSTIFQIIKFIPFFLIVTGALVYLVVVNGLPWWIAAFFILFLSLMGILMIRNIFSYSSIDLKNPPPHKPSSIGISVEPDEQITTSLVGISKTGFWFKNTPRLWGPAQTTLEHPENALIITNKHLHFVYVPIPSGDQMVGGDAPIDFHDWGVMFQRNTILTNLNKMISTLPLVQILKSDDRNFSIALDKIKKVSFTGLTHSMHIETFDKQKFSYAIINNEDYQKAKQLFPA